LINLARNQQLTIFLTWLLAGLLISCGPTVEPFTYEIEVRDTATGAAIANAVTRAEIGVRDVYQATTNANGVAQLTIAGEHLGRWAKVIVEADDYKRHSVLIHLLAENRSATVGLEPLSGGPPAGPPVVGPLPPPTLTSPQLATDSETLTTTGVQTEATGD
jgi:hypothetical protein